MNAFTPAFAPATVTRTSLHVWRADPFTTARAPQAGYYAVALSSTIYHRVGEAFAPELLAKARRWR